VSSPETVARTVLIPAEDRSIRCKAPRALLDEFTAFRAWFAIFLDEFGRLQIFFLAFVRNIMRLSFDYEAMCTAVPFTQTALPRGTEESLATVAGAPTDELFLLLFFLVVFNHFVATSRRPANGVDEILLFSNSLEKLVGFI
jgi:hypothetical protein